VIVGAAVAAWPAIVHRSRAPGAGEVSLEKLDTYGDVPKFSLVERSGRRIGRRDLLGKVWVLDFMYTECTETCPVQSLRLAKLQRDFAQAPDLRLVSITVDPQHDTTEVLKRYAERYGADRDRWLFLTGDKRQIYCLAKNGFRLAVVDQGDASPAPCERSAASEAWRTLTARLAPPAFATHGSQGLLVHSSRLVLVDRRGRIRAYHQATDEESLARLRSNLKAVLAEGPGT
jgi:protein SCO1/2